MTRSCRAITAVLSAYLDGEATVEQARACEQHLESCAACRAELAQLERARSVLRSLPPPAVPPELAGAIKLAAARELARERTGMIWPVWAKPLAAAAALVVAITVGQMLRTPDLVAPGDLASLPPPVTILEPLDETPVPADTVAEATVADQPEVVGAAAASREMPAREASEAPRPTRPAQDVVAPELPAAATVPAAAYALATDTGSDPTRSAAATLPARGANGDALLTMALAPRLTPAERRLSAPALTRAPSAVELELAGGVVAAMLVEDFIEEHLIESTPTLLSVAIGTPSTDLGPRLVEGEDDAHFELCFTDAMRRALSGRGE